MGGWVEWTSRDSCIVPPTGPDGWCAGWLCVSAVDESHTLVCVCVSGRGPPSVARVTIDVTRWMMLRFVKRSCVDARCREGTRGAGFLNPMTLYSEEACETREGGDDGKCDWWRGVAAVFRRIVFAAAARVERKRPIRRRVASRGTRVDRSIAFGRSRRGVGDGWWCSVRSTEGRAAAVGVSVRVPLGRTRRCRCRASSRVESMDGTNANANASRTRGDAGRRPRATPFRNARVID